MTAEDLRQQAAHCRGRAVQLRRAAGAISDICYRTTLLGLSASYDCRAETLEKTLGLGRPTIKLTG